MIKRILVGLGGTAFTSSKIRHAVELATRHGAAITGVTIFDADRIADVGPIPVGAGTAAHELREHRARLANQHIEESIERFKLACTDAGIRHHVILETGDVFEELISLWRYHDVTILGLRALGEENLFNQPHDYLLRLIARGVRPLIGVAREYRPIRRVLVAYNGSMESAKAMKQFAQLNLWQDVSILVVYFGDTPGEAKPRLHAAKEYFLAHGFDAEMRHIDGSIEEGLDSAVQEWSADMVVLGSTHRSRFTRLVFGDAANHLVHHASIPLFMSQ